MKCFVHNRVTEILTLTLPQNWRHATERMILQTEAPEESVCVILERAHHGGKGMAVRRG